MSYTKHEWQNDELITAAKMNNIEEGIAEGGGGGGICLYAVTTNNFPSSSNTVGYFGNVKKTGDTYSWVTYTASANAAMLVYGNVSECYWLSNLPIPTFDDVYLVFQPASGVTIESSSDGISSTPIIVNGINVYIITGDFRITLNGWL